MNITTITEDGKFVIPPYIQSKTGLLPGASVEFETSGSALVIRLYDHITRPKTTKQMAFWDYVGSIKFKGKYDPEVDRETMMNEVAEHALGACRDKVINC
jgi:bifunctional DNA-binding transcriptional regulator/antitoxin component of YhaV-PrlF toxin-antitoxin module